MMAEFLITFACVLAMILMMGMIGDKDASNRKNFTIAFCIVILMIIVLTIKFL